MFYYLCLIEDFCSRKAVCWDVYEAENGENAAVLMQRSDTREKCWRRLLVLHSDNGAPMKSVTLLTKMYDLGITPSRGRPPVSNDNPYSESLFRAQKLKYCPQWTQDGFSSLDDGRIWVRRFMVWYNTEHCHSRIRSVTSAQRHERKHREIWPGGRRSMGKREKKGLKDSQVRHATGSVSGRCISTTKGS